MKKRLSFICFVVWICIISITVSGCRSRNQNQANDSVVTESASDELTQFREKFTIKNILSLLDNPKNKSYAQKCGLEFILEDKDEYGGYQIIYGYDVEKGKKTDNWYDINALSEHSTYFKYECCESVGWMAYFKSKEDADYFINEANKHGFAKKDDCYTNGKWGMSMTEDEDWCCCQIYEYVEHEEYEETTENSNSNNGMSGNNDIRVKEYQEKTMRCVGKIQDIMRQINSIYNSYVSASIRIDDIRKQSLGVNAIADISDLIIKGDDIFKEMIRLANEYGQQGNISTLRAEQEDFKKQGYQMSTNIRRDIYNEY